MYVAADVKKVDDSRKAKEMGQLRKEARRREHQIQSLESNAKRREAVLKRRQEEVWSVGVVSLSFNLTILGICSET